MIVLSKERFIIYTLKIFHPGKLINLLKIITPKLMISFAEILYNTTHPQITGIIGKNPETVYIQLTDFSIV